jgi:hypothetical protein
MGFGIKAWADFSRADGYLIYRDTSRPEPWKGYDAWRSTVCHRNRNRKLWIKFRMGETSKLVLLYALYLKIFRR